MPVALALFVTFLYCLEGPAEGSRLVAFTFGDGRHHSVARQIASAGLNDIELRLIGPHGNVARPGELDLLRDYVGNIREPNDTIVLLVESASVFLHPSAEIVRRFRLFDAGIVLSAGSACRPDASLAELHPAVSDAEKRFVDADGLLAYADVLLEALREGALQAIGDRQYFFSKLFTDPHLRTKHRVKLDSKSVIFQNLDEKFEEVRIEHSDARRGYVVNKLTNSSAAILQRAGNKQTFDSLSNYIGKTWDPVMGCQHCPTNEIRHAESDQQHLPLVTVAIFIEQPTPFLEEFFTRVSSLSYPKSRINIRVSNKVPSHESLTKAFVNKSQSLYSSVAYTDSSTASSSVARRLGAIKSCVSPTCEYLLFLDSLVQLTNTDTIQALVSYNTSLVAPLVSRREQLWSNFWGAISEDGYYSRSFDYLDIVNGVKKGIWNVPHVHSAYLMKSDLLASLHDIYSPVGRYRESETDMIFSANMRSKDLSMFVANEEYFGHLVDAENTTTEHLHNDLWEIFANPLDWREKYIHENYSSVAAEDVPVHNISQPCPDVFCWPFVSETFARHMTEEMEFFGQWSDDSKDIHLRQIDWEVHWMQALHAYVYPMQVKLYKGYYDEPLAKTSVVVRHKPVKREAMRHRHHDASSYTLNMALSYAGVNSEGGGIRFSRYNCDIATTKVGWVIMHPGRLTHIHEELPARKGTMYILISLINP